MRALLPMVIVGGLLLAGCSSGDKGEPAAPVAAGPGAATGAPASAAASSLGVDDLDQDGTPDPDCGQQDFGAGLVLRIPCTIPNPNDPDDGTRLVKDSLYRLPSYDADLTGISGSLVTARATDGKRVVIFVFNSDNLFATGSDRLGDNNTLDPVVALINAKFAGGAIQVRGHTDKTGTASNNQALSERRAATVRDYLTGHGVKAGQVSAAGLGSSQPLVEETNPDGSPSLAGRAFNRRVELAIRLP
ncbi:OmpA family protein [Dactylosporangium sp. CA-139066]|uniref:OmpA family protein n=1 Tax=Dactylosporangium sp. CA-139066 TaxID=3239930 RepID=UPI003D92BE16